MPKETFFNLNDDKKTAIENALIKEFESKPLCDATVKNIVEDLSISRGSFYQYFHSLEESYFYILDKFTSEVHLIFLKLMDKNRGDIKKTLLDYGKELAGEIYKGDYYSIYKNKFLYWNVSLDKDWKEYLASNSKYTDMNRMCEINPVEIQKMNYLSSIVHSLMQRLFLEDWSKEEFLEHYNLYVKWIIGGIIL